jgi:hypothetical protein
MTQPIGPHAGPLECAFALTPWSFSMSRTLGQWFVDHYRARQRTNGTASVARQMRKQGFPIEVALSVLASRV